MKPLKIFLLLGFLSFNVVCWSQVSVSLNPSSISPSSYNVYTQTAGDRPGDLLTNYTSQTIKYTWPFFGDGIFGNMYASITGLPAAFKMTVLVTGSSGFWDAYGVATANPVALSSTEQVIISNMWSASNRTRGLTQNITIDLNNFAALKAGNKIMTVTYTLY